MSDIIVNGFKKGSNNHWIHIDTGIVRFTHPNHIGYCSHCQKDIITEDDMAVKSTDDGNVLYCKKCFDEDKMLNDMLRDFMSKNKLTPAEKARDKARDKATNEKYKNWLLKEEKREKEADEKYKKLLKEKFDKYEELE